MKISINSHSSIRVDDMIFDPFDISDKSSVCYDTKASKFAGDINLIRDNFKAKIIFLTHTHFDHLSIDDIKKVAGIDTIFVAPKDAERELSKFYPKNERYFVMPGVQFGIGNLKIETIPAYNIGKKFHPKENNWLGYKIEVDGETFAVLGDCDKISEHENLKCDVLFVPIGGTYTTDAAEAADLANAVRPKIAVPTHFGKIVGTKADGVTFEKLLDPSIKCINLLF